MKILFFTELSSIHAARWIDQLSDTGWEIHVINPWLPGYGLNPAYRTGRVYYPLPIPTGQNLNRLITKMNKRIQIRSYKNPILYNRLHLQYMSKIIQIIKPDIVHSLGLNINWRNLCFPVLKLKAIMKIKRDFPWIYSSWGSDLEVFAISSTEKLKEVKQILGTCDYYIAECKRDYDLAMKFGFKGNFLGYYPAFGGINIKHLIPYRCPEKNKKNRIFLKGRDNCEGGDPIGRAMTALQVFENHANEFKNYEIIISQASPSTHLKVKELQLKYGLKIKILGYENFDTIMNYLGSSKIFIALTVNDGLPSSLVEAMAIGTFPIHSNLDPIREWITDGKNGFLVPPEDPDIVGQKILNALSNEDFRQDASNYNISLIHQKLSTEVIKPRVIKMYNSLEYSV